MTAITRCAEPGVGRSSYADCAMISLKTEAGSLMGIGIRFTELWRPPDRLTPSIFLGINRFDSAGFASTRPVKRSCKGNKSQGQGHERRYGADRGAGVLGIPASDFVIEEGDPEYCSLRSGHLCQPQYAYRRAGRGRWRLAKFATKRANRRAPALRSCRDLEWSRVSSR